MKSLLMSLLMSWQVNAYAETNHNTHANTKDEAPASVSSELATQSVDPLDFTDIKGMTLHEYLWGGLTSTVFGFGAGHALQGRYFDNGWIFTTAELASTGILFASIAPCKDDLFSSRQLSASQRLSHCNKGGIAFANLSYFGVRIWEILDSWLAPSPSLRKHLFGAQEPQNAPGLTVGYLPPESAGSGTLNFVYKF